ncbi:hypothetical protein Scep_019866 [Stephania cephalantha]|uniref:Uncharacterized protein n=1 Tax=Stephania cephalantha TaxID=152367 RepID=A0AAP0IBT6_9MAGN
MKEGELTTKECEDDRGAKQRQLGSERTTGSKDGARVRRRREDDQELADPGARRHRRPGERGADQGRAEARGCGTIGRRREDDDRGRGRRWIREDDEVEAGGVRGRRRLSGGATMSLTTTADRRLEEDDWCE